MNQGGLYTISSVYVWKYTLNLFETVPGFSVEIKVELEMVDCGVLEWRHHKCSRYNGVLCEININLRECFCSLGYDFSVRTGCSWVVSVSWCFMNNLFKEFEN